MNTFEKPKGKNSEFDINLKEMKSIVRFSILPLAMRTASAFIEKSLENHNEAMIDNFGENLLYPKWRQLQDVESSRSEIIQLDSPIAKYFYKEIGAKAENTVKMMIQSSKLSASVPLAFSLPVSIYDKFVDNDGKLPNELKSKIISSYEQLCRKVCAERGIPFQYIPVAVRSSGVLQKPTGEFIEGAEDSAKNSFAGLNETLVNVVGPEALIEAIEYVMSRCGSEAAREYMIQSGINPDYAKLPVMIQEMVVPETFEDAAGVINTVSRTSNDHLTIEVIRGGGEYCVGCLANGQFYTINRNTLEIEDTIVQPQLRCLIKNPFGESMADTNLDVVLPGSMKIRLEILSAGLDLNNPQNVERIIEISQNSKKDDLQKKYSGIQLAKQLFENEVIESCLVKTQTISTELLKKIAKNLLLHSDKLIELSENFLKVHDRPALSDKEIIEWAVTSLELENKNAYKADLEYVQKDNGEVIPASERLLQIRPLTGHFGNIDDFGPERNNEILCYGLTASQGVVSGQVQFITEENMHDYIPGRIPIFDRADNIYTAIEYLAPGAVAISGSLNGHAANIASELGQTEEKLAIGFPYLVAVDKDIIKNLKDGDTITIDTWSKQSDDGVISLGEDTQRLEAWKEYRARPFVRERNSLKRPNGSTVKLGAISSSPEIAQNLLDQGFDGITLQRTENLYLKKGVHPLKMIKEGRREELLDFLFDNLKNLVDSFSAEGLKIAIRAMDFQGPDMKTLEGYDEHETQEPAHSLIGDRGAYRLTITQPEILDLEADLLLKLLDYRNSKGIETPIKYFIPFVRDPEDVIKVFSVLEKKGIFDGKNGIKLGIMAELASNRDIHEFLQQKSEVTNNPYISFVSLGGNDGHQSWLGVHREFQELRNRYSPTSKIFTEGFIRPIAETCYALGIDLSFCGNAASSNPEFAKFLFSLPGITEIGIKPDSLKNATINLNQVAEEAKTKKFKFLTPFNLE